MAEPTGFFNCQIHSLFRLLIVYKFQGTAHHGLSIVDGGGDGIYDMVTISYGHKSSIAVALICIGIEITFC